MKNWKVMGTLAGVEFKQGNDAQVWIRLGTDRKWVKISLPQLCDLRRVLPEAFRYINLDD
jgi:hypothetical protein